MNQLLLGLFGGVGATVLWEVFLKPFRERRSIAEVLSAEISLNLQLLAAAKVSASPSRVPPDFELSTMVFEAVAERIGELPPDTVGEVIFVYSYFKQLSQLPKTYTQYINDFRACPVDAPHRDQLQREINSCVIVFNGYVEKAINRVNITQPLLLKSAFPWWSPRRWSRRPSRELPLDEIAHRLREEEKRRAQVAADIQSRGRT